MSAAAEVLRAGLHTTVQDLGRRGWARLGVPPAGVLDEFAARAANRLVGNGDGAAVLECTLRGPALRLPRAVRVAVVGAPVAVTVAGVPAAAGRALDVPAGAVLDVGAVRAGLRCWVAVAGGVAVPEVLGSRSVDTLTGLGGGPLADGDPLPLGAAGDGPGGDPLPPGPWTWSPPPGGAVDVRVVAGPHAGWFDAPLDGRAFTVTPRSDRTGLRLAGPAPARREPGHEVASHGLVAGAVQLPPGGEPVVLLAGHQTTGGYPVPAVVCAADLPLLAQARPGQEVRFTGVDVGTARAAYAERLRALPGGNGPGPGAVPSP